MIEFKNVSQVYETGSRAVRDINLVIRDGEFVFITGRSGSGKSTLLKLITRELKASSGEVLFNGKDLRKLRSGQVPRYRRSLGVIFQDFRLLNDRNVYENIAFAQRVIGASSGEIRRNVPEMMQLTGISAKYKNMPNQLSGGEQQRVAIARALINRPEVILADEPTGNLDEKNSYEILDLLLDINAMGTTVVLITHSRQLVESVNKRVIVMNKGQIVDDQDFSDSLKPFSGKIYKGSGQGGAHRSRGNPAMKKAAAAEESGSGYFVKPMSRKAMLDLVPWDEEDSDS